jgi:predicted dehydrogenase
MIDRRTFLKNISLMAGTTAAVTSMPWIKVFGSEHGVKNSPSDRVRLGVIGVGDRGFQLIQLLQSLGDANYVITSFCDDYQPNYERIDSLLEGNATGFRDYRRMLDAGNIDGVIIATPLHEHAHMTIDALDAGIHVFCEKAMARTLPETLEMYQAHKETGKILQIGHQRLFNPVYLEALESIDRGQTGKITQIRAYWHRNNNWRRPVPGNTEALERKINWRHYREYSGGLWTELASHHIQVANWVKKTQPVSVSAKGSINFWNDGREVDDNIAAIFSFDDGMSFIYDSLISNKHHGLQVQVMGNKATLELETNQYYLEEPPAPPAIEAMVDSIRQERSDTVAIGSSTWEAEVRTNFDGTEIVPGYDLDDSALSLEAFIRFIREGSAPDELLTEGYRASVWSLLAEESARTGKELRLPARYRI